MSAIFKTHSVKSKHYNNIILITIITNNETDNVNYPYNFLHVFKGFQMFHYYNAQSHISAHGTVR